jgi:hypothetical protein
MFRYKLVLSKDWSPQVNHVIVTSMIEKHTAEWKVKSRGAGREMEMVSDKDIQMGEVFDFGDYSDGQLRCKVIDKQEVLATQYSTSDKVRLTGAVSYSYVRTSDNQEICPVRFRDGAIIELDRLVLWIENNTGIKVDTVKVKTIPKEMVSKKIIIYNQFYLDVEGSVLDPEKVSDLDSNSIGKRKSYGLGWMTVEKKD